VEFQLISLYVEQNTKLSSDLKEKLALFCNVKREAIIQSIDVDTIYDVPLKMLDEGLDKVVLEKLQLTPKKALDLKSWNIFLEKFKNPKHTLKIGLVGNMLSFKIPINRF